MTAAICKQVVVEWLFPGRRQRLVTRIEMQAWEREHFWDGCDDSDDEESDDDDRG